MLTHFCLTMKLNELGYKMSSFSTCYSNILQSFPYKHAHNLVKSGRVAILAMEKISIIILTKHGLIFHSNLEIFFKKYFLWNMLLTYKDWWTLKLGNHKLGSFILSLTSHMFRKYMLLSLGLSPHVSLDKVVKDNNFDRMEWTTR